MSFILFDSFLNYFFPVCVKLMAGKTSSHFSPIMNYSEGSIMAEKKEIKLKEAKEGKETKLVKGAEETSQEVIKEVAKAPVGNFVYIGKKGAMAYVLAVVTQFGMGAKDVIVKARGKSISHAVDVAEIVRNRDPSIKVVSIGIATEEVITQEGRPLKISSIEIVLKK